MMNGRGNFQFVHSRYGTVRLIGETFWYDDSESFIPLNDEEAEKFISLIEVAEKRTGRKLTISEFRVIRERVEL